jgi:hypothetical protein
MIRLYSDRRFLKPGARPAVILYPFWGKPAEDPAEPLTGRFDRYMELGPSLFAMTSLEEADVAIIPAPWEDLARDAEARNLAYAFMRHVRQQGKRIALFCINDVSDPLPFDDVLIFRTSFYRSKRRPLELAQPAWIEDFVEKYLDAQVPIRPKRPMPTVGFCGYAGPTGPARVNGTLQLPMKIRLRRVATDFIDTLGLRTIRAARGKALNVLQRSPLVDAHFIMRNDFLGPTVLHQKAGSAIEARRLRQEYVDNIVDTDYTVCARGQGNYSIRLFETLACGRIPIFVDTECPLPFHYSIDWNKYVVWVKECDIGRIDQIVADYHASMSPDEFVERQLRCRELWKTMLSPAGFFANFHRHLQYVGWQTMTAERHSLPHVT